MNRFCAVVCSTALVVSSVLKATDRGGQNALSFGDSSGRFTTITDNPDFNLENPFFKNLGTNDRSCSSCHVASDAWTITPEHIQARFWATNGQDPLFQTNDGSNCADSDISTFANAKQAFSLLMTKGLIRVSLAIPPNAEFELRGVDDPYGCAATPGKISVYRRVLPATNLRFLSTVMWDGRESAPGKTLEQELSQQVIDATLQHALATTAPSPEQVVAIVAFELGTHIAQSRSRDAGALSTDGGQGGPEHLSKQNFFIGINDPLGGNPTGEPSNPSAFTLYQKFGTTGEDDGEKLAARASIRRGEAIFNTRQFTITGVAGLPSPSLEGTCTTCHDTPNVGNHSVAAPLNLGLADASRRTPDLPLYTLYCPATRQSIETTDPGRALISGKCADIGKFKGPVLRGVTARAPYFHNGSAETLEDVVEFYDTRFQIGLNKRDIKDLVAFLNAL